ncbi:hypothetical protein [Variovorax sp. UMC13]|uniref:hypothetical protein n=1 Tax=Variovorax sp. UMC13 TaxID=1862326 RepID=UPI0016021C31|nr:hypothetical protein [Variovorax sp. UMC13]MBB1600818.1 hypothetical protein [Variovorax sp. UMC13]
MTRRSLSPPRPPSPAMRTGLIAGGAASFLSTLVLLWRGERDVGSCSAPTNATSHWLWRDEAFGVHVPTWRHTATGYVIHHGTATLWAVLYAWLHGNRRRARSVPAALAGAAVASAVACTVDYTLTPKRFTPGFEHHLSKSSMVLVYAGFALGLAAGCLAANRGRR